MSEDISGMIRVGVTIILVATLVAVVLNLAVIGQSTLNSGMSNLQAGVTQISQQEFQNYNQRTITGTEVQSAIQLYSGRDIAILVATKACQSYSGGTATVTKFYNYGCLVKPAPIPTSEGQASIITSIANNVDSSGNLAKPAEQRTWYQAEYNVDSSTGSLTYNNNTVNTQNPAVSEQYILNTAQFRSYLIRNNADQIIGMVFIQRYN